MQIEQYIDVSKSGCYAASGEPFIVGHIGCYRVYADSRQVRLSGSVAKLVHGENVSDPTRKEVAEGVQWLSDALHLNVGRGDVCRVDVAHTFNLPAPPKQYICQMASREDAPRVAIGENTLYLASNARWLCFYDKQAEMASRGEEMPTAWAECQNLLRYEMRIVENVSAQVGAVKVSDITKPQPWARLVNMWADDFRAIKTATMERIRTSSTPKEAFNAIFADLLQYAPANYLSNVLMMIKKSGAIRVRQRRGELKDMIEKAINGCNSSLISQLNADVERVRTAAVNV